MSLIKSREIIFPSALSEDSKKEFIANLYKVHSQIFDGTSEKEFADYVVNSKAEKTKIKLFKNVNDEWVGYCATHRFVKNVSGREVTVFRAEAGLLREYRGHNSTFLLGFVEAFKYKLLHPLKKAYYLGTFVHPSIYYLSAKYFREIYPSYKKNTPPAMEQFMSALADAFNVRKVREDMVLVRYVDWITRDSKEERAYWWNCEKPEVKLFRSKNPHYDRGYGLVTVIPLTLKNLTLALYSYISRS